MATTNNGTPKPVRCAIYTRKSTEEGLAMDFNTLDAQRESGEAYTRSQAGEGWLPHRAVGAIGGPNIGAVKAQAVGLIAHGKMRRRRRDIPLQLRNLHRVQPRTRV